MITTLECILEPFSLWPLAPLAITGAICCDDLVEKVEAEAAKGTTEKVL